MKMAGDVLREMNDRPDVREFIDVSLKIGKIFSKDFAVIVAPINDFR